MSWATRLSTWLRWPPTSVVPWLHPILSPDELWTANKTELCNSLVLSETIHRLRNQVWYETLSWKWQNYKMLTAKCFKLIPLALRLVVQEGNSFLECLRSFLSLHSFLGFQCSFYCICWLSYKSLQKTIFNLFPSWYCLSYSNFSLIFNLCVYLLSEIIFFPLLTLYTRNSRVEMLLCGQVISRYTK